MQVVQRQCAGHGAGVPDFQAIGEQADFDRGVAVVVAMSDGVDDGFADGATFSAVFYDGDGVELFSQSLQK